MKPVGVLKLLLSKNKVDQNQELYSNEKCWRFVKHQFSNYGEIRYTQEESFIFYFPIFPFKGKVAQNVKHGCSATKAHKKDKKILLRFINMTFSSFLYLKL